MNSRQIPIFVAAVGLFTTIILIIVLATNNTTTYNPLRDTLVEAILYLTLALIISSIAFYFGRILNKNPTTITLSILGLPHSGKTVYLTVLFDLLLRTRHEGITFVPYGLETIEQVTGDVTNLLAGNWLAPTKPGTVFYYRANASVTTLSGISRRRFKLEIADYAGEYIEEFDSSSPMWLHKSDYFKYVIQSEGVFLTLDAAYIYWETPSRVNSMLNNYIAAMQILAENKGSEDRKLKLPVAILFLKSDEIWSQHLFDNTTPQLGNPQTKAENSVLDKASRLLEVCRNRCENFNYFFVSSVGEVVMEGKDRGSLTGNISPKNVVEPLLWILRKL
jgi:GTPase SAR1 family protein